MPLSKDQVTAIIRKRRYKSLYKYIEHLQYWAAMKQWEYSRSHAGYDAAAVPQYVYRYWHKRAMEISNYIQLVVHPNDHLWLLDQLFVLVLFSFALFCVLVLVLVCVLVRFSLS